MRRAFTPSIFATSGLAILATVGAGIAPASAAGMWIAPAIAPVKLVACVASGKGRDLTVGPGRRFAEITDVPWETLGPGDTVRIFARATPYRGKFLISAKGTAAAPVRVCGVRGADGRRPVISGENAVSRRQLRDGYGSGDYNVTWTEGRGIVFIGLNRNRDQWTDHPSHIRIDGLAFEKAHPNYRFTDTFGKTRNYVDFGAAIWVDRGWNITLADNQISDSSHAIFSRSIDNGGATYQVTQNLRIAYNDMWGNGIVGDDHVHTTYVQSRRAIYEFNRYGPMRKGALGGSLKDRSSGTVIRYNRIEDGARAIDLVEPEDWPAIAKADPAFRTTLVYGNQIRKDGRKGSTIHYGGDHMGSEADFRKGTLYFWSNTVFIGGRDYAVIFQPSTTDEHVEAWNNLFFPQAGLDPQGNPTAIRMRSNQDTGGGLADGGHVHLGRNWIWKNWSDNGPWGQPIGGSLTGTANLITGLSYPVDLTAMVPIAGRAAVDGARAPSAAVAAAVRNHPVDRELVRNADGGFTPAMRPVVGKGADLGARERP